MATPGQDNTAPLAQLPLAVDLDGTLIRTDIFSQSMLAFLARAPWRAPRLLGWLARGRAYAKARLAVVIPPDAAALPYDARVVGWLREERARGRIIALATASDRKAAEAVADHVGVFTAVFASDGRINLKSSRKATALRDAYPNGFVYAGNERADWKVWRAARGVVLVNAGAGLARRVTKAFAVERCFPRER